MRNSSRGPDRSRPRLWHHDYLHLRPLAVDLEARISAETRARHLRAVLDLGCGSSPYRPFFGSAVDHYVRLDLDQEHRPSVLGRAEALPFPDDAFDAVLSSQTLGLFEDVERACREITRVMRPGAVAWITGPAAWPQDSARMEHRFGPAELARLLPDLNIREIVKEGGMLALPLALVNVGAREALRSAERRFGMSAHALSGPASALYLLSNVAGRALEKLAERGPLASFLGYLDARLPMNYLVVAVKEPRTVPEPADATRPADAHGAARAVRLDDEGPPGSGALCSNPNATGRDLAAPRGGPVSRPGAARRRGSSWRRGAWTR